MTHELHQKANRAAEALGISTSALLAELVERLEVDADGKPTHLTSPYAPQSLFDNEPMGLSA